MVDLLRISMAKRRGLRGPGWMDRGERAGAEMGREGDWMMTMGRDWEGGQAGQEGWTRNG